MLYELYYVTAYVKHHELPLCKMHFLVKIMVNAAGKTLTCSHCGSGNSL